MVGSCAINGSKNPLFSGLNKPYSANNLLAISSILIALNLELISQKGYPEIKFQTEKHQPRTWLSCLNRQKSIITQKPSASNKLKRMYIRQESIIYAL